MIEYKKAGLEEVDELVRIRMEFLKEAQPRESAAGDAEEIYARLKEYLLENMKAGSFLSWVAMEDGRMVGTSGLYFYTLPPSYTNKGGRVAYVMNMYTKPPYRGRGIAPALFEKLILESRAQGCSKITLNATAMGRPIYEKFGFTIVENEMVLKL